MFSYLINRFSFFVLGCILALAAIVICIQPTHLGLFPHKKVIYVIESGTIEIKNVAFGAVPGDYYISRDDQRSFESTKSEVRRQFSISQLRDCQRLPQTAIVGELASRDYAFDIWDAIERGTPTKGASAVVLSFTYTSPISALLYLGLGCNDDAVVELNGLPIYATVGRRDFSRCEDLIPMEAVAGNNTVRLLCRKTMPWTVIPRNHGDNQWLVSLSVFRDSAAAWKAHKSRNWHVIDLPIVSHFGDLRLSASLQGHLQVDFIDFVTGRRAKGAACLDGTIAWATPLPEAPVFGILSLGDDCSEPILVTASTSLIHNIQGLLPPASEQPKDCDATFWRRRLEHLISNARPNFSDPWWDRSILMALSMAIAPHHPQIRSLPYWPNRLSLHPYRSAIDGTEQIYISFTPDCRLARMRPTVLLLPSIGTMPRPYLFGPQMAGLHEMEDTADSADEHGLNVIWPGIVDVDYGGELSRSEIDEVVKDAKHSVIDPLSPIFVVGTCSSGIMALGYAETRQVSGLVLERPMIARTSPLSFNDFPEYRLPLPHSVLDAEQTDTRIDAIVNIPVFLFFNLDIPGHGDRAASVALCNQLQQSGGHIDQLWPPPEHEPFWGERARIQTDRIFKWVTVAATFRVQALSARRAPTTSDASVKGALLKGFHVQLPVDSTLRDWFNCWAARIQIYRGTPWEPDNSSNTGFCCAVVGRVLSAGDLESIQHHRFFLGSEVLHPASLAPNGQYCGFRLASPTVVEIFRSPANKEPLPNFDPLLQGMCRGAILEKQPAGWKLLGLWI